jgi:hypothetical protein
MLLIGKFAIFYSGSHWVVSHHGVVMSQHESKWDAIKAARGKDWLEKRPPAAKAATGGNVNPNRCGGSSYNGDRRG